MFRRKLLPRQQVAKEISGRHRLNFLPQTVERVTVNAGQQTSRRPFSRFVAGCELAADNKAFRF
jgi:hypothetical protein